MRFPARACTARNPARSAPATLRRAKPDPAVQCSTPDVQPLQTRPPQSDIFLPAPDVIRTAPPAHHRQSISSSCFVFVSLLLLISHRQRNFEPRSLPVANRALPIQLAPKLRDAPRHNRQTEPRALRLGSEEWLQDFFAHTFRNTRPVVFHRKQISSAVRAATHFHEPPARSRFQGIHHKIRQNLAHGFRTRPQRRAVRRDFNLERDTAPLRLMPQNSADFFRHSASFANCGYSTAANRWPAKLQQLVQFRRQPSNLL